MDETFFLEAVREAGACTHNRFYNVGAVIVQGGIVVARAHNEEDPELGHAEAIAIGRAKHKSPDLSGATLYVTMVPCDYRKSGKISCCQRIIEAGIVKVAYCLDDTLRTPLSDGPSILKGKGIEVIQMNQLKEICIRETYKNIKTQG